MRRFIDLLKSDSVAYGPLIGLPLIAVFLSATAHGTKFVAFACIASFAAIALLFLMIRKDRPVQLHSILCAIAALIVVTVALTHWPLQVGFTIAEARLNEIAEKVESGGSVDGGNAGWFTISNGRLNGQGVVLEVGGNRFDYSAFVRSNRKDLNGFHLRSNWYLVDTP